MASELHGNPTETVKTWVSDHSTKKIPQSEKIPQAEIDKIAEFAKSHNVNLGEFPAEPDKISIINQVITAMNKLKIEDAKAKVAAEGVLAKDESKERPEDKLVDYLSIDIDGSGKAETEVRRLVDEGHNVSILWKRPEEKGGQYVITGPSGSTVQHQMLDPKNPKDKVFFLKPDLMFKTIQSYISGTPLPAEVVGFPFPKIISNQERVLILVSQYVVKMTKEKANDIVEQFQKTFIWSDDKGKCWVSFYDKKLKNVFVQEITPSNAKDLTDKSNEKVGIITGGRWGVFHPDISKPVSREELEEMAKKVKA